MVLIKRKISLPMVKEFNLALTISISKLFSLGSFSVLLLTFGTSAGLAIFCAPCSTALVAPMEPFASMLLAVMRSNATDLSSTSAPFPLTFLIVSAYVVNFPSAFP